MNRRDFLSPQVTDDGITYSVMELRAAAKMVYDKQDDVYLRDLLNWAADELERHADTMLDLASRDDS